MLFTNLIVIIIFMVINITIDVAIITFQLAGLDCALDSWDTELNKRDGQDGQDGQAENHLNDITHCNCP